MIEILYDPEYLWTLNICEFREWIDFVTIKGSKNKYLYVWEIFLQSYDKNKFSSIN